MSSMVEGSDRGVKGYRSEVKVKDFRRYRSRMIHQRSKERGVSVLVKVEVYDFRGRIKVKLFR